MRAVVANIRTFLASPPEILPLERIGVQMPAMPGDLPAIVLGLALDKGVPSTLGRLARSGHSIVQHTGLVEVDPSNRLFSPKLDSLRIDPLPVRKNPASLEREFGPSDVLVRNVTLPQQSLSYRFISTPAAADEYRFEVANAQIRFGGPQKPGNKLEVIHWTVGWREDITSDRLCGILSMDLCTATFAQGDALHAAVETKIRSERGLLRQRGFFQFDPCYLESATAILQSTPFSSGFPLWKLRVGFQFAFEGEQGGDASSGGAIRRINVRSEGNRSEDFSVPVAESH